MVSADTQERELDSKHRSIFRKVVGSAVETILTDEIRVGLSQVQDNVLRILRVGGEILSNAFIETSVNAFFLDVVIRELRSEIKKLTDKVIELENTNKDHYAELMRSMKDELTGIYLRKYFLSALKRTFMMLRRESHGAPAVISLALFDIDHFKKVNDTYGHEAGDKVLAKVGEALRNLFKRDTDILGRWGGEEFVIALPGCNESNAGKLADDLRRTIAETDIEIGENGNTRTIRVTISTGVTTAHLQKLTDSDIMAPINEIIRLADSSMYSAKRSGRNAVRASTVSFGEKSAEDVLL